MKLDPQDVALGFGVAGAVGALIGLERERKAQAETKPSFGGIRTFPLISLAGALGALLTDTMGPLGLALPLAGLIALLIVAYIKQTNTPGKRRMGLTTEIAG